MVVNMTSQQIISTTVRRSNTIVLPEPKKDQGHLSNEVLATLQMKVAPFGFVLSPEALVEISALSKKQVKSFADELILALSNVSGKSFVRSDQIMYPNFPEQVAEAEDAELFMNAMLHYFGDLVGLRITPVYHAAERVELAEKEMRKRTVLSVSKETPLEMAASILRAPMSVSKGDMDDVETLSEKWESRLIASLFPHLKDMNRENLAYLMIFAQKHPDGTFPEVFKKATSTATDVLRYAVGRSEGDVSLAKNHTIRFVNFSRPERRMMVEALNTLSENALMEDFARHVHAWKRLARVLHPGDFSRSIPVVANCFRKLAEGDLPTSFAGKFDASIAQGKVKDAVALVSTRPGEFARRLNHLLTVAQDKNARRFVLSEFQKVASEVPTSVLWQMLPLFENRNTDENRIVFPKGNVSKSQIVPMPPKAYGDKFADKVTDVLIEALMANYGKLDSLGKVYVDPALSNFTVPVGLRSASKALNAIGRGTRIPFTTNKVQRFYLWWTEGKDTGRLDVDLSAVFFNDKFEENGYVDYTHLRNADRSVLHSGDFTSAPKGAAEYIDVDVERLRAQGVRYVCMSAYVFSGSTFNNFECFAGVMGRDEPQADDVFDPRTTERTFEISADSTHIVPMVLDLESEEIIWADLSATVRRGFSRNVQNNLEGTSKLVYSIVNKRYADLAQLLTFHAFARGEVVDTPEEAETVFSVVDGLPSVTLDEITSQFI